MGGVGGGGEGSHIKRIEGCSSEISNPEEVPRSYCVGIAIDVL